MKQVVIIILLLGTSLNGFSQPVSVDSIVAFYKNANIECYKEIINNGMKSFDKWLTDTFPKTTMLHSSYSPSDIDLREHNAIPIVALKYYNMDNKIAIGTGVWDYNGYPSDSMHRSYIGLAKAYPRHQIVQPNS